MDKAVNTKGGSITVTIDLLFDWFGLACFANKNKIVSSHTADSKSQTGGQWHSDTSPFSIPWTKSRRQPAAVAIVKLVNDPRFEGSNPSAAVTG